MPASLSIQRPRHATCQPHFRPSGRGMRHASVTFDPAAAACDMPALLSTQRPRHATCRRYFRPSGLGASADAGEFGRVRAGAGIRPASLPRQRPSGTPAKFGRVLEGPPAGRVGAYCIRPTGRHHRWRIHVPGYDHSSLAGASGTPAKFAVYPASFPASAEAVRDASQVCQVPGQIRRRP